MRNEQQVPWEAGSTVFLAQYSHRTKARFESPRIQSMKKAPTEINRAKTFGEPSTDALSDRAKSDQHQVR
jgi:hypothetical protein